MLPSPQLVGAKVQGKNGMRRLLRLVRETVNNSDGLVGSSTLLRVAHVKGDYAVVPRSCRDMRSREVASSTSLTVLGVLI